MRNVTLVACALLASGTAWAQTEGNPLQIESGSMTVELGASSATFTFAGTGSSPAPAPLASTVWSPSR
jgi:hypothetical protein